MVIYKITNIINLNHAMNTARCRGKTNTPYKKHGCLNIYSITCID